MDEKIRKNENAQAKSFMGAILATDDAHPTYMDADTRSIWGFAEYMLEKGTVKDAAGAEHSALLYAMWLYSTAETLVNQDNVPAIGNKLLQVATLVALEEGYYSTTATMSYGSKLLFDAKKAGIKLGRNQIAAFLAQEGTWASNRSKSDLMNGNLIAVGIYCARLKVLCQVLPQKTPKREGTAGMLEKIEEKTDGKNPEELLTFYLNEFALPYLESAGSANGKEEIQQFLNYLRSSDFYRAPCSTRFHLCEEGGLAQHTINVLMQMLWLTLPATKQQLGACVLAAIGHDLCKVGVYARQEKNRKIYLKEGQEAPAGAYVKSDSDGNFYWGKVLAYEFHDTMPFGHGRKSAYMLQSFFPEIGEDVYAAVDGHMGDTETVPALMELYSGNPMALHLHIADMLATHITEAEH